MGGEVWVTSEKKKGVKQTEILECRLREEDLAARVDLGDVGVCLDVERDAVAAQHAVVRAPLDRLGLEPVEKEHLLSPRHLRESVVHTLQKAEQNTFLFTPSHRFCGSCVL